MVLFDWLLDLISDDPRTYPLLAALVLLDADLPVLPGETAIVTASIAAANGSLIIWLVVLSAIVGGVAGDNISYWIGRTFGKRVYFRFFSGERDRRRYAWAEAKLREHGSWIIPSVRFVPGGRTAVTLAAGGVRMPWRSFFVADLVGVVVWASLYSAMGYFGGGIFREQSWVAFAVSFAAGAVVMLCGWAWYRLQSH